MSKYRDFDAFWAEKNREPITFTACGKKYNLPPEVPASLMLQVMRLQQNEGNQASVSFEAIEELLTGMLGEKQYKSLLSSGIGMAQLTDVLDWIMVAYNGAEDAEGNPEAPQDGAAKAE
ncbi:MAG: hypothetical protein PHO41_07275 [Eubacteriales bacterium]|nr:hypothetical protein [Eubacteriales bacterium]